MTRNRPRSRPVPPEDPGKSKLRGKGLLPNGGVVRPEPDEDMKEFGPIRFIDLDDETPTPKPKPTPGPLRGSLVRPKGENKKPPARKNPPKKKLPPIGANGVWESLKTFK